MSEQLDSGVYEVVVHETRKYVMLVRCVGEDITVADVERIATEGLAAGDPALHMDEDFCEVLVLSVEPVGGYDSDRNVPCAVRTAQGIRLADRSNSALYIFAGDAGDCVVRGILDMDPNLDEPGIPDARYATAAALVDGWRYIKGAALPIIVEDTDMKVETLDDLLYAVAVSSGAFDYLFANEAAAELVRRIGVHQFLLMNDKRMANR